MRRKSLVLLSTLAFLILSVGTVLAYFSFTTTTPLGWFETGSTQIEVLGQSTESNNLAPGETHSFEFSVQNTGTLPVFMRGYFDAAWSDQGLDPAMVTGLSLEVDSGNGLEEIKAGPFDVADIVYFSADSTDQNLWFLQPSETWIVRVTVQLDPAADTEYMLAQ